MGGVAVFFVDGCRVRGVVVVEEVVAVEISTVGFSEGTAEAERERGDIVGTEIVGARLVVNTAVAGLAE